MAQMGMCMVCPEPADHTSLSEARGNVGACLAPLLLPVLWHYLNLLDKEPEGIHELVGRRQYFSASDDLLTSLFSLAMKLGSGLG